MKLKDYVIRAVKKSYQSIFKKKFENLSCDIDRQSANDKIYDLLISESPCMISRFGTTELITINNYLCVNNKEPYLIKIWNYISDKTHTPWWFEENFKYMWTYSGIFPPTQQIAEIFSKRYIVDTPLIDLLGSFQYYEKFMPLRKETELVHLETLYPFFVERPWTRVLKGKKVLVVHPFDNTIQHQYQNRTLIFEDEQILPEYELITLKAIQSAADIEVPFKDWFEALKYMEDQISAIDFDICLLGCGAYGLPLAAHIKRLGKKSVHIGGGLQLMFGIKGRRWENDSYLQLYDIPDLATKSYKSIYNENWVKPFEQDTPKEAFKVDEACYW